ncbi:HesB/YadR/YfhF family protein [Paenibacillus tarimensis]
MRLVVEDNAARWYKREMSLEEGDQVRIFVRLGGCGSVQPGFSLGLTKDTPRKPALQHAAEGILFYMEEDNLWYLDGRELYIVLDEDQDDIRMEVRG